MTFQVALAISSTVLSVLAIALSLIFFFKSNDLFVRMNQTEARIEEIGKSTAEKITLVVEKAIEFWTRPTQEDQAAWETEVREIREQVASLSEGTKVTAELQQSLGSISERLASIEWSMTPPGMRRALDIKLIAALGREAKKTGVSRIGGVHSSDPSQPTRSKRSKTTK